jgi:cytochrome P450
MELSSAGVDFFSPKVLADPYSFYDRVRADRPVHKLSYGGKTVWMVTTYDLTKFAFGHPELFSNDVGAFIAEGSGAHTEVQDILANGPFGPITQTVLLVSDEPTHKRYRSLVNTAFAPPRIAKLGEVIDQMIDELIDGFVERGACNFTTEFAVPLPIHFTAQILGLDKSSYGAVREWSDATLVLVGKMGTKDEEIAAAHTLVEAQNVLLDLVRRRRVDPREDLATYLVRAESEGEEPLRDEELVPLLFEMLVAGNETTRNTLIGGMVLLHQHPEQLEILRQDPSLTASAVEEILRYYTPLSGMWRRVTRDLEFGRAKMEAGDLVMLRLEAANRDETQFPAANFFDIRRSNARTHLSFGYGLHHCLGNALARRQINLAVPKLLSRLRNSRLDAEKSDLERKPSLIMHALGDVHLTFDSASKLALVPAGSA